MSDHAILSASSSSRWIHCPPSVRLSEKYEFEVSPYALEGTSAHALGEYKLRTLLGQNANDPREDLDFYNEEMEELTEGYGAYVMEVVSKYKNPGVYIEERLDLSRYVRESFGTADCIVVGGKELHVIDLKYGQGVLVDAKENSQLMLYGLGALTLFDGIYDIEKIILHIYQPRRENISTYEINTDDLYSWGDSIKEIAEQAYKGDGEYSCGPWCKFCPSKNRCRKRAEENLQIAKKEFTLPPELSDEEIEEILPQLDLLEDWVKDIKAYALEKALKGHKWQDFKLVEGRSNRKYRDEDEVVKKVKELGFNPFEEKLLGITAMTKLLGKKVFDENISDLLEKPKGKLTLVGLDDKREEVIIENIKEEFGGFNNAK
ncbi:MAG: DUF2800 domain-containing protein [Lagierella massiliensis]|nr:DUF2800 domain-containing protein [Lagierella massiliensis]MDO5018747.1 DUF2800 domain-containing protein [Lagierella massiliensis]MDO5301081.1 DUF2800 domain-containing protein [Tissierellia bacterium]